MEETLGKRIAAHRRRLGLTQDRLAELLGVTAQAVSKWENDQSCPDITLLPKLAETFRCTTDELLGLQQEHNPAVEAEILPSKPSSDEEEDESDEGNSISFTIGDFDVDTKIGRKNGILMALWIFTTAGLLLLPNAEFWGLLWRTGLFFFGIGGLWPHFSVFRLACALFGGYCVMNYLSLFPQIFNRDMSGYLLPAWLALFAIYILTKALRKPGNHSARHIARSKVTRKNRLDLNGETFACSASFGDQEYLIDLPRLTRGTADVSFGSLTVDLSGCEEIGENCRIDLDCSFGELTLRVPRQFRVVSDSDSAFGNVEIIGNPIPDTQQIIPLSCDVSFGQITVQYI